MAKIQPTNLWGDLWSLLCIYNKNPSHILMRSQHDSCYEWVLLVTDSTALCCSKVWIVSGSLKVRRYTITSKGILKHRCTLTCFSQTACNIWEATQSVIHKYNNSTHKCYHIIVLVPLRHMKCAIILHNTVNIVSHLHCPSWQKEQSCEWPSQPCTFLTACWEPQQQWPEMSPTRCTVIHEVG